MSSSLLKSMVAAPASAAPAHTNQSGISTHWLRKCAVSRSSSLTQPHGSGPSAARLALALGGRPLAVARSAVTWFNQKRGRTEDMPGPSEHVGSRCTSQRAPSCVIGHEQEPASSS